MNDGSSVCKRRASRRRFLKGGMLAAGATVGSGLLGNGLFAFAQEGPEEKPGSLPAGDAAVLRFLAAAEIIESDIWQQYAELGGQMGTDLPFANGGNGPYVKHLQVLDMDMPQYISDNTDDEFSHANFINAYLASKGADTVNLDQFRTLPGSKATGAQSILRLTNLMQLTVDTTWWTRYRSDSGNPDLGDTFPPAIASLASGQHPAIPRDNTDLGPSLHLQAIANTAAFHFAWIEQGGTSLYAKMALKVKSLEVLRIIYSIGGTEIMHFQLWQDKAGNAPPLTDPKDPSLVFPNLNMPPLDGELFSTNRVMPEPCPFLDRTAFPVCSIIRPTDPTSAASGALTALTNDGLFIGQTSGFFDLLNDLAEDADEATR